MEKKPILVILSAGKVIAKLPFLSSLSDCPALVPLGIKSSLLHQIHFYEKKVSKIIILTNPEHVSEIYKELLPELLKKDKDFFQIQGCKTKNVNKTLQFFCKNHSIKNTNSYIFNLSTSLPSNFLKKNSFTIDKKKTIQQNWSSIILKKKKISKIFYRKNIEKKLSNAFIGIFRIEGKKINYRSISSVRKKMGYAVQGAGLFPHLTIRRNITLLAQLSGWEPRLMDERCDELLDEFELDSDLAERYPHSLSGGQQQRVGLCRALMLDPKLLLLDEPFSALDPITRGSIYEQFLKVIRKDKSIILVTHDINEALKLAGHLVILRNGKVIQEGKPHTVINHPAEEYVKRFFLNANV